MDESFEAEPKPASAGEGAGAQAHQPNDHWYLARLKPAGFERAKGNLARQGFASFMPMQRITEKKSTRFSTTTRPLFAGYLFIRIPPEDANWRAINSTFGVAKLVAHHPATPTRVDDQLIAALRLRCDLSDRLLPAPDFETGTQVRVVAGPFARMVATIDTVPDSQRVWILLEIMGQSVRTAVQAEALQRA